MDVWSDWSQKGFTLKTLHDDTYQCPDDLLRGVAAQTALDVRPPPNLSPAKSEVLHDSEGSPSSRFHPASSSLSRSTLITS
eukprot:371842-Rhodomonas_salina.2